MKKLIYIVSFVFLTLSCTNKPAYELNAHILQKETTLHFNDSTEVYSVKIILNNNSQDTLEFWTMSCSWHSNFIFNSDSIGLCTWDCDKNIFELIRVPPKRTKEWIGNIWTKSTVNNKFKIGFIINKKESTDWHFTKLDTIWSKPLKFN